MFRALAATLTFLLIAAACSSDVTGNRSTGSSTPPPVTSASIEQTQPPTVEGDSAPNRAETTLVSAANGGVVTFGNDVILTVPAGALSTDTEIGISAIPESDWPEELTGLEGMKVIGDFLRLSPDGLIFDEPAILSRRVADVAQVSDGDVTVSPSMTLSRSDGTWAELPQTVVIDDDGAVMETRIEHFSDNVVVAQLDILLVRVRLTPTKVQRLVGHHFVARLSVDIELGATGDNFWRTFFTVDSGPLLLGIPSEYRVLTEEPKQTDGSIQPEGAGVHELIAPFSTPTPLEYPAAFNCTATGKAVFGSTFQLSVRPVENAMDLILESLANFGMPDSQPGSLPSFKEIKGTINGEAECVDKPDDLTPGLFDVTSDVASDPAGHSCCVKPPPRKARMTLGSLWFTDAKLGDSNRWQGLFFDSALGSAGDVMNGVNDSTESPPNTVEIGLADDFDQTGRFSAEGVGTVAGFPDIRVKLEAVASDRGTWSGTLTKGVNGGLPTGQAIVYDISGSLIAPKPVAFVDQLAQAFRDGDSEFLLDHLHPEVLGLYAGACVSFTNGISSPDLDIAVHSFDDVADWTVTLDGHELTIPNAVSLDVTRTEAGETNRTVMHVAARPGDGPPSEMTWFADCGNPFPIG